MFPNLDGLGQYAFDNFLGLILHLRIARAEWSKDELRDFVVCIGLDMFQNLVCSADHEPASGFFSCPLLEISGCFSYQLIAPGPESDPEARAEMI